MTGTGELVSAGKNFGAELDSEVLRNNRKALVLMLALMRLRVGKDTGVLLNSIVAIVEAQRTTVTASEPKPGRGGAVDVARTTEFGRGRRVVADENWHATSAGARPKARAPAAAGGQPARPFFLNSAAEALARRAEDMAAASDAAARKTGWL